MSIIFILILISAFSSYIFIVNQQIAHNYDIVLQIEKNLKSFYETEFVIYYVFDFYQKNHKDLNLPYSKDFILDLSSSNKKIPILVEIRESDQDISILISIYKLGLREICSSVQCHLKVEGELIKLKCYQIEKRGN